MSLVIFLEMRIRPHEDRELPREEGEGNREDKDGVHCDRPSLGDLLTDHMWQRNFAGSGHNKEAGQSVDLSEHSEDLD